MKEIKQRKERRFLKILGRVGEILVEQVLLKLGSSIIRKIGGKKTLPSILFLFASLSLFAQYPATGNKQRLGFQTTGDGLVYRGRSSDTLGIKSSGLNNAYFILDTVNNILYNYIKTKGGWQFSNGDTIIIQGVTMPFDSITFNTAKNGTVGVGEVEYNNTQGSLIQGLKGGNVTNVIGQQLHQKVNNRTGATLTKGTAVYLSGSQGNRITVAKALGVTDAFSANTFGIVAENIANNQNGYVITEGLITNINTSALTEDSAVYLSPTVAGGLTSTKPQAPQHTVYIGVCVKSNPSSGELFVKIFNGQELNELHDVRITSPIDMASLYYRGGLWRDTTASLLVSDTASMLTPYFKDADTTSLNLTSRFAAKLNISDTVSMLTNYIKSNVNLTSQVTGILPLLNGGTGASTQSGARTNLGGTTIGQYLFTLSNSGTNKYARFDATNQVTLLTSSEFRTSLGATVRGANTFILPDLGAISFLRYNADNTVSQRAADGMRTDLGGTTIGQSMFTLTNPSAITFPRFNADNTVSALDAATFRTAIGAGTGSGNGTVTSVSINPTNPNGLTVATSTTTPVISMALAASGTTGVVSNTTQQFSGAKTFLGDINGSSALNVTGSSALNGGATIGTMATTSSLTHVIGVNSSNAIGEITLGTGLTMSSGTLSATSTGTVTSVSVGSPANGLSVATGTTTPVISMALAGSGTIGVVSAGTQVFSGSKTFEGIVGFNKSIQRPITTISGNTTILTSNCWIIVNNSGGTTTLTLPDATLATGSELMIKTAQPQAVISASSNVVPLTFANTPSTSILPATDGAWCTLVSNGTYWVIMASN